MRHSRRRPTVVAAAEGVLFRADPAPISSLQLAGVDCVVLANNHVLDCEEEGLLEMLKSSSRKPLLST